ncbi:hypothetical protein HOH87_07135 [bacterium]|jgi:hypothetical protein|nr:hypothetical protein [bacterium]
MKMKLIIIDWAGYPLFRNKDLLLYRLSCGLAPLFKSMDTMDAGTPFSVTLVINDGRPEQQAIYKRLMDRYDWITDLLFRDNVGQDFGAYQAGYQSCLDEGYDGEIAFLNTSIKGPVTDGWLLAHHNAFNAKTNLGVYGLSMDSHYGIPANIFSPHVQSYFLYTTISILKSVFPEGLPGIKETDRKQIINKGEVGFSSAMLNAGYGISCAQYPDLIYRKDDPWTYPVGSGRFKPLNMAKSHQL